MAGKNREVTRDDVRRAIDAARAVSLPAGREILHVLPQDFVVDEHEGIGAPVGLTGARLEVNVHIITGSATATQNLVSCVNRAGVEVTDRSLAGCAAPAVLTPDEARSAAVSTAAAEFNGTWRFRALEASGTRR